MRRCNGKNDPAWRKAVGYDGPDKNALARNLIDIVGGKAQNFMFTTHQDYWAGEELNLRVPAQARYLDNGLQ